MAKTKEKGKKAKDVEVEVDETEDEDLEDLDLEDLADEEVDDEAVETEDEDEDEPKAKKKKSKAKAKKESSTIGSADLAETLEVSGRELRVMLRDHKVEKNENGRYEWASVEAAMEELGFDDLEEAQEALAESRSKRLEALKERVSKTKKSKGKKKKAPADEDEED